MNKKAIAILGAIFILIVGTLGFLIYSRSGSGGSGTKTTDNTSLQPTPTPTPTNILNPQPTPSLNQAKINKLTDNQVVSPALTFDGSGVAYFTKQGLLFRASFALGSNPLQFGDIKQLAIEQKPGINKVYWPPNSQDFLLEYNASGKKTFEYYNNTLGVFTTLPPQVYSLGYLPSGDKIYYVWSSQTGYDTVNASDPDTKNYKTISDIWDKNAVVYVSPDGQNIVYHQDPAMVLGTSNPLTLTDIEGKTWKKIVEGFVDGVLWSPDGRKFLFGKKDSVSQNYQLWYYDLYSGEVKNLGFFTTPNKAVWGFDNQTVYLAVPLSPASGGVLTLDSFYKLNTATAEKKQYDSSNMQIDGEDLFLSQDNSKLFFRNGQDGGLYYLDLSQ